MKNGAGLAVIFYGALFAQSTAASPAFEVADVHPSTRSANQRTRGGAVMDSNGLNGAWNFDLKWGGAEASFDTIDKQLGLKLEPQKVPIPLAVAPAGLKHNQQMDVVVGLWESGFCSAGRLLLHEGVPAAAKARKS